MKISEKIEKIAAYALLTLLGIAVATILPAAIVWLRFSRR